jgi:hypothetical protein
MDGLLLIELLTWVSLVLVALLALLTLGMSARRAIKPSQDMRNCLKSLNEPPHIVGLNEKTMARWSRIVKKSNTSFWIHVSHRSDVKR